MTKPTPCEHKHLEPYSSGCRCEDCGKLMEKPTPEEKCEEDFWRCKHCGSTDCWFDRTITVDANGEEDGMHTRCNKCGKHNDEETSPSPEARVDWEDYEHESKMDCGCTIVTSRHGISSGFSMRTNSSCKIHNPTMYLQAAYEAGVKSNKGEAK